MCDCDCEEDYYEEPEPEQPPGLPGWVLARLLVLLEPVYGEWHWTESVDKLSVLPLRMGVRDMFRQDKPDGVQFSIRSKELVFGIPTDLYSSDDEGLTFIVNNQNQKP